MGLFSKKKSETIEVAGKQLQCLVCGSDHFWQQGALLNTAGLTFLELDWANKEAACCICDQCGYIHWFLPE